MAMGPLGDLGPVTVTYNNVDLGSYFETVRFRFSETSADVKEALHGQAAVDAVLTGHGPVEVDVPFTRQTYANLMKVLPGGSNSGGESGNIKVKNRTVGTTMYANSYELILKRVVAGVADTLQQYWLHFPKAFPVPHFDVPFDNGTQRAFLVTFKAFPDATSKLSWHIGDIA
uniref:Uncharacterized protein n=1 Tax=viral metagenome TaxID=1070528 RepID=A0A6M3JWB5_9ZZZZ